MLLLVSVPWEQSDTGRAGALGSLVLRLRARQGGLPQWEGLLMKLLLAVKLRCSAAEGLLCLLRQLCLLKAAPAASPLQAPRGA